jgi:hypothetical protein
LDLCRPPVAIAFEGSFVRISLTPALGWFKLQCRPPTSSCVGGFAIVLLGMKICSKCSSTKNEFPKAGNKCKPCVNEKIYEWRDNKHSATKKYILESKAHPCQDCGASYPHYVMDFDHRGDKAFIISKYRTYNKTLENVKAEIAKCDLVCANCHRIRTFTR